jgi:hypothetical protein
MYHLGMVHVPLVERIVLGPAGSKEVKASVLAFDAGAPQIQKSSMRKPPSMGAACSRVEKSEGRASACPWGWQARSNITRKVAGCHQKMCTRRESTVKEKIVRSISN